MHAEKAGPAPGPPAHDDQPRPAIRGEQTKPVVRSGDLRLLGDEEKTRGKVLRAKRTLPVSAQDGTFAFEVLEIARGEA